MPFPGWPQNLRPFGWRRFGKALSPSASPRRRRSNRPNLESLEGRLTPSFGPATSFAVGPAPVAVTTGDFNNDGRLDLVTANSGDNTVGVLLANGAGTFQTALASATGTRPVSLAPGDFNADGRLDVVTANSGD